MREEQIPPPIREAIRAATTDRAGFAIACRLFVDDASDSRPDNHVAEGSLDHAVARATLDAWLHGQGSAESVGHSYATVGNRVAHVSRVA